MTLFENLRIDSERLKTDFDALAAIGKTDEGGVDRSALGESHLAARRWFKGRVLEDRLDAAVDGAGNHSAILRAAQPGAKTLLLGSHLDSVPNGGRFDGALGVLAALEVVRTVQDARLNLPFHLEAIDFTDEEGTLIGLLGSRAVAGTLTQGDLDSPRCGRTHWLQLLERAGISDSAILGARRRPASLEAFLEVHIEQGPVLKAEKSAIGIVQAIAGIRSIKVIFNGRADHAGTTPMADRLDAAQGAAAFIQRSHALVRSTFARCVLNVGRMKLDPGAMNIVPAKASVWVEFRAPDGELLEQLHHALLELGTAIAAELGLGFECEELGMIQPAQCGESVQQAFRHACHTLGVNFRTMFSGAGHDTMALSHICPAGMVFVPSSGGSHSPREFVEWHDCVNGANVLLHAVLTLASRSTPF